MTDPIEKAQKYITPLYINGLNGRVLRMKGKNNKNKEILFLYGHHASLERVFGFAEVLSQYGTVTIPDWPGFGGMDSFYRIGKKPDLDNLADYMAAFIKLRYKNKKIAVIGVSMAFLIVTRMLQKHPKLVDQVEILVSGTGFVHKQDFVFTEKQRKKYLLGAKIFSTKILAWLTKTFFLNGPLIKWTYRYIENPSKRDPNETTEERNKRWAFEVMLWRINDFRTHMFTLTQMLDADVCNKKVNLPVHHIEASLDQYFNRHMVEQHMMIIFKDFKAHPITVNVHAPTVTADKLAAKAYLPPKLLKILSKQLK